MIGTSSVRMLFTFLEPTTLVCRRAEHGVNEKQLRADPVGAA